MAIQTSNENIKQKNKINISGWKEDVSGKEVVSIARVSLVPETKRT